MHAFGGTDGLDPLAALVEVGGKLFGTTRLGGTNGYGTVFSVDPASGAETVVYSFCGATNCTDGAVPQAALINVGGTLYGTTAGGGTNNCARAPSSSGYGCGTVFSINPATGAETVVYTFRSKGGSTDGYWPVAGLIDVKGKLYGTTVSGGKDELVDCNWIRCGTVFSIDPRTGKESVLHNFQGGCTDGAYPYASLTDVKGTLYGTTLSSASCSSGFGTIFSLDPRTGAETPVFMFQEFGTGNSPFAPVLDINGALYGTTSYGAPEGKNTAGVVYTFDPTTGIEKVLHFFRSPEGEVPKAGLIEFHGKLYGTTELEGINCAANGCGSVFSIDP